jgi:hypothetical protein
LECVADLGMSRRWFTSTAAWVNGYTCGGGSQENGW